MQMDSTSRNSSGNFSLHFIKTQQWTPTVGQFDRISFLFRFFFPATLLRKEQNISRPMVDDPFALDGFGDCKSMKSFFKMKYFHF